MQNSSLSLDDKLSVLEMATGIVAVDTEINPLGGVSVSVEGFPQGFYFPVTHAGLHNVTEAQKKHLFSLLHKQEALGFHNAPYDLSVLEEAGFAYKGKFYCSMLMAHWVNEERYNYSLDSISKAYGGKPKEMPEAMKNIIESDGWAAIPAGLIDTYASHDAYITRQLIQAILPDFQAQGFDGELWEIEQQFIRDVIIPMKRRGIKLDLEFAIREYMRGTAIMEQCVKDLGFNPGKASELKRVLIDEMELPVLGRTKTGRIAFTKKELKKYEQILEHKSDPRATTILRYRGWQKTVSSNYKSYLNLADDEGVLHPNYKLHGTVTSRLSCEDPNLQQIPKASDKEWNGDLKKAFIPRPGFGLWTIDYSQLQFRMAVSYAGQEDLIDIFNDATRDIFSEMAKQLAWTRDAVKTLVYLTLFGGGAETAKDSFGITKDEAQVIIHEFNSQYPMIKKVAFKAQRIAQKLGFIQYWTGRRRHFPPGSAFYRAFNAAIQGGEAEIIKRAMIKIAQEVCDENCHLLLQIHDEIVFEIRDGMEEEYLAKAQKVMETIPEAFCEFTGNYVKFATSAGPWGKK